MKFRNRMTWYYAKSVSLIILGIVAGFYAGRLLLILESESLRTYLLVVPRDPEVTLDPTWIESFEALALFGIEIQLGAVLAWHLAAMASSGRETSLKYVWMMVWLTLGLLWPITWLTGVAAGLASVRLGIGFFGSLEMEQGMSWATIFYLVNVVAVYWVATLWFTPASHKYDPVGAIRFRGPLHY